MMNAKNSWKRSVLAASLLLMLTMVWTSCKKDNVSTGRIPAAGLMIFNLAPDQQAIGVALSGRLIGNSPLMYTSYSGLYQSIFTGSRDIDIYNFASDLSLAKSNFDFQDSAYYSLFVVGNKGSYRTVTVKDNVDTGSAGDHAFIRYINAIPDSSAPTVTINAGGSKLSEAVTPFAQVSSFQAVNTGDVAITVNNGSTINASRTITVEKGKIYTALLIGDPAATDTTRKIQIRYILNGTVSPI